MRWSFREVAIGNPQKIFLPSWSPCPMDMGHKGPLNLAGLYYPRSALISIF